MTAAATLGLAVAIAHDHVATQLTAVTDAGEAATLAALRRDLAGLSATTATPHRLAAVARLAASIRIEQLALASEARTGKPIPRHRLDAATDLAATWAIAAADLGARTSPQLYQLALTSVLEGDLP